MKGVVILGCGTGSYAQRVMAEATGIIDFEKARMGWELSEVRENEDKNFSDRCDLCNQSGLTKNYVIEHENTRYRLSVGSKCIRKFVLFKGIGNQQDSNRYFDHKSRELYAVKSIGQLLTSIMGQAIEYSTVYQFRKRCADILDCNISDIKSVCFASKKDWEKLIKALGSTVSGGKLSEGQLDRVRLALFNPRELPFVKKKIRGDKYEGFQKKRTRATTTLAKSSAYENPENKYK
jgi:hypothetical protein